MGIAVDLDVALEAGQDMLDSITFNGKAIGRSYIDLPDITTEAQYRAVVERGNANQTVWILSEGPTSVQFKDAARYSYMETFTLRIQGFRPFEYGTSQAQSWRQLYMHVLRQINRRAWTRLGLDASIRVEGWNVSDNNIRGIGDVDSFQVLMETQLLNQPTVTT